MKYAELFRALHPDFFSSPQIRAIAPGRVLFEQVLDLHTFSPEALEISVPESITFGLYEGPLAPLHEAVAREGDYWVPCYDGKNPAFCAYDGKKIVSFCLVEDMGRYQGLHIGGPGCVGTLPEYRGHQIGLKMVQLATGILQRRGFNIAYIHYTHIDHWYAKLGYKTVLRWNRDGVLWDQGDEAGADLS